MKYLLLTALFVFASSDLNAQVDVRPSAASKEEAVAAPLAAPSDASTRALNTEYTRPTFFSLGSTTQLGGYTDANMNYLRSNGLDEGLSMEMRHFNLFVFASISPRISLLSEVEFEHGTDEISLESAQLDCRLSSSISLRAGILLAPLGAFNQRHDSPLYEFVDRPLVSTRILPGTLSLMGFGIHGRMWISNSSAIGYDAIIANGLGDKVIDNTDQRTVVSAAKNNDLFEESNNGIPAVVARVFWNWSRRAEVGASMYEGVYNKYRDEGVVFDAKRSLRMAAVDYSCDFDVFRMQGETAWNSIELPPGIANSFASKQWGSYLEVLVPLLGFEWMDYHAMQLNAAFRGEIADYNVGSFSDGTTKVDDEKAFSASLALRPTPVTTFRLVYQHHWIRDVVGNASTLAGLQFGFATYF